MSVLIDKSAVYLHNALCRMRKGVADMVRFRKTSVPCWRCAGHLETYYCEQGVYALRCDSGCSGVFLAWEKNPEAAAEKIAGSYVGEIPGGGVPGC